MKKRTLPILLLLAGLSATAFAACGHEHSYSWKQSEDGKSHYQECECGEKINEGAHKDADSNGKCDDCGADVHVHQYTWKQSEDGKKHYQQCACGDKINEGAHKDANSDEKCDDCGADMHVHQYTWKQSEDGKKHYQQCACGDKINEGEHKDANSDEKCDDCGADLHVHQYTWKETEDGKKHFQECACGDKINEGEHKDENSDEKCDVCGITLHDHVYTWKSDVEKHWQECTCEYKINEGTHKDANSDNKCDDCARDYYIVTFAMHDHGTAPEEIKVISGGKINAPDTPADEEEFKFKGWFKDEEYKTAFDFANDSIEAATTIHAKWEEDTTAGASKAHAHVLEKGEECLQPAKNGVVYFKYVAEETGRFTVSLGMGINSQNATFTTSLTGDTVFGKDQDAEEATFDLGKGETVYIAYTFLGEAGDDATAGVIIEDTYDEPLPADHFLNGEYEDDNYTLSITFDREAKTVTYGGNAYPFTYVGGIVDSIFFTMPVGEITVHYEGEGAYSVKGLSDTAITMRIFVAPTPVALSAISGYYEPKNEEDTHNGITAIYIYESDSTTSTSVRYVQNGFYYSYDATYDAVKNRLKFGYGNLIMPVLTEDGAVECISIGGKEYAKNGEAGAIPPSKLDIESSTEYNGETYQIRDPYGYSQYFGTGYNPLTVISYIRETGMYTITATVSGTSTIFKLTISDDKKTITLYNADGEQIDTLTLFEFIYHDLPTTETQISIAANEFQKGCAYLFKVETAGWYAFTGIQQGVSIHYNLSPSDPISYYNYNPKAEEGVALNFAKDAIFGVFMNEPAATTFTVAPAQPPAGWEEDNPRIITDGPATITAINADATYYFAYTATKAGRILVNAFFNDGEGYNGDFVITYSIDGTEHSFKDYSANSAITKMAVTAGQVININVIVDESQFSKSSITVTVAEDYSVGATELTLEGAPENDTLILSATATSGSNYYLASTNGSAVKVTGSAAFTVKFRSGAPVQAKEEEGTFTATIRAGEKIYFTIDSDTEQTVTLSQTFAKGSAGYPVAASAQAGENTVTVTRTSDVYFTLPAGNYIFTSESTYIEFADGITTNAVISVKEGDVLSCGLSYQSSSSSATFTIREAAEILTAQQVGTYKAEVGNTVISLTLDAFGTGTYKYSSYSTAQIAITAGADDTYTFTYAVYSYITWEDVIYNVTISFVEGNISVTDSRLNGGEAFTLEKEIPEEPVETIVYTGKVGDNDARLEITGDKVSYYFDMGSGFEADAINATLTESDGTYSFQNFYGNTHTFTISDNGSTVNFHDGYSNADGALAKKGAEEPVEDTTYTGIYDNGEEEVAITITVNATFTEGTYVASSSEGEYSYSLTITTTENGYEAEYEDFDVTYTLTLTINGDKLHVADDNSLSWFAGEITLTKEGAEEPAEDITYIGSDSKTNREVSLTIDEAFFTSDETTATAQFVVKDTSYGDTLANASVTVTKSGNEYSFSYIDSGMDTPVTFTVEEDGTIKFVDSYYNTEIGSEFTVLTKQVPVETITYTGKLGEKDIRLEIAGDKASYYIDLGSGVETDAIDATLTESDGTYSFENSYGDTHTFTISDDGSTVTFHDGYYNADATITKEA